MTTWQQLPKDLQLKDEAIAALSFSETEALFLLAEQYGVVEEFAQLFWEAMSRVRNRADNVSIQKCIEFLEERKRTLGRAYSWRHNSDVAKKFFALRYNECEYNIRWLVEQYDCTRKTKPYLLEV